MQLHLIKTTNVLMSLNYVERNDPKLKSFKVISSTHLYKLDWRLGCWKMPKSNLSKLAMASYN